MASRCVSCTLSLPVQYRPTHIKGGGGGGLPKRGKCDTYPPPLGFPLADLNDYLTARDMPTNISKIKTKRQGRILILCVAILPSTPPFQATKCLCRSDGQENGPQILYYFETNATATSTNDSNVITTTILDSYGLSSSEQPPAAQSNSSQMLYIPQNT